ATLIDGAVPWQVIQRYYARHPSRFREELFEPHIQREDLSWHSIEKTLSYVEPSLGFWQHTAILALPARPMPVSLNVLDVALNYCNQLPYQSRLAQYFRRNLWSELAIRYLKHDNVEQMVIGSLEAKFLSLTVPGEAEFESI